MLESLVNAIILALVVPGVLASPTPAELARAELAVQLLERAQHEGKDLNPIVRQLFLGQDNYAPYQMPCPSSFTWVRPADSLGSGESAWRQKRQPKVAEGVQKMMRSAGLPQPPRTPVIAYALSGGGYRAMQVGLGGVMGTMNASAESAASATGGWFDAITYMAGLSGGSWGTATFIANGGQNPLNLVGNNWNLQSNVVVPDDDKTRFYYNLVSNVDAKGDEGFPTQITDYWGLALANHINPPPFRINTTPNFTMSNLTNYVPALADANLPMPIIIAAEREPGEYVIAANATTWEFTPYEFGAWAFGNNTKVRGAFTPIEYLGTSMNNGQPNGSCYKGFDQMSFVTGTSATLFTSAITTLNSANASGFIVDAVRNTLNEIGQDQNDIAQVPNAFRGYNADNNPIADFNTLTLVDAGLTNQNIPLEPLLVPQRGVDAILAFDSSADTTYSWPNGSALFTTYDRSIALAKQQDVSIRMPAVPSTNGFVNGGWNTRPTFFGCGDNETDTTLIVYVPNYPWSDAANKSTFQLAYEHDESRAVINNGARSLTLNASVPTWPKCLACALSDRSFSYTSSNRSSECQACFNTWCWNYAENTTRPNEYEPVIGSVPPWIQANNLLKSGGTNAPSTSGVSSGSSAAAVTTRAVAETPSGSSSASKRAVAGVRWWSSGGAVTLSAVAVMIGALAVLL